MFYVNNIKSPPIMLNIKPIILSANVAPFWSLRLNIFLANCLASYINIIPSIIIIAPIISNIFIYFCSFLFLHKTTSVYRVSHNCGFLHFSMYIFLILSPKPFDGNSSDDTSVPIKQKNPPHLSPVVLRATGKCGEPFLCLLIYSL